MPLTVNCPACREPLEVDDEYRAWKVRCPRCGHEFYPDPADAPALAAVPDDAEPRRRRRREFDDDDDPRRAAAEVSAPATALKALAWLGLVVSVFAVGIWVLIAVMVANDPQVPRNMGKTEEELYTEAAFYIVQGVIAFGVSIVMLVGAMKMSGLQSHSWATTAAVCGMIPCISPCCLLGMPFGIWALSVLNRPHVRAAFRRAARGRLPHSPADHDDYPD